MRIVKTRNGYDLKIEENPESSFDKFHLFYNDKKVMTVSKMKKKAIHSTLMEQLILSHQNGGWPDKCDMKEYYTNPNLLY